MSKWKVWCAGLALLMLCAAPAWATGTTLVAADTLFNQGSPDSTDVFYVGGAARVWVDFIVPPGPPCDICFDEDADTAIILFVQVRERLSAAAGTDSTLMPYEGISADSLLLCRQYVQGVAGERGLDAAGGLVGPDCGPVRRRLLRHHGGPVDSALQHDERDHGG